MNYIVCFYWQGDRWRESDSHTPLDVSFQRHLKRSGFVSNELASKYINNLFDGVRRFTTVPFKFICFTVENLKLNSEIEVRSWKQVTTKGVLPRMYMFSKEAGLFGSQVLSFDIELIITGSLDDLLNYRGLFCTRQSWTRGEETLLDGDIISFQANEKTEDLFWAPLVADINKVEDESKGGRERFWIRHVMEGKKADVWQDICPGQVVSYKHHVQKKQMLPENARIVSCHGYPRPHQIEDSWRKQYWE